MGWKFPPPVMVMSGTEGFLLRRNVRGVIKSAEDAGCQIEYLDGEDSETVSEYLSGGLMFEGNLVVVCSNPAVLDLDVVTEQTKNKGTTCLLLVHDGTIKKNSKLGKAIADVPSRLKKVYAAPDKSYKVRDAAIKFLVQEAKRYDKELSTDLAEALTDKVGLDYGVLSFEVLKVATYMDALDQGPKVTPKHVVSVMLRMGETNFGALVEAVGKGSTKSVLREMDALASNFPGDEGGRTLAVCTWVGNQAVRWLHAAALDAQNAGEEEAASRMGVHPYIYKRFILPVSRRWGLKQLSGLVKRVSKLENSVRTGHVSPWVELECALVLSCRAVGGRG